MMSFANDLVKKIKDIKIKDDGFINILLLGETGVGKSTFINSIANYLTYNDFNKAEKEELLTLIPSKCKVKDKYDQYHEIQIGSEKDQNECLDTGMSATQDVKSYVFPIWKGTVKVRLIDTPGIGDVRGIDQDNINCENILSYIGQLHELHAICYLFKPTSPRITVYFAYCMTQILSRLDKSASQNIIFIFTNTRGTDYGPGETFPSLQKVIDDIKSRPPHVNIPLNKNVFCFDNEAFRYLAAIKKGVEFDSSIKQRNRESWKRSVEQCTQLIQYITGDSNNPPLTPHFIKSTNAINEARRLVVQLSQPLADISQLISDNLYTLQKHQEDLDLNSCTLEELKEKLYMPVIDLLVIKLTQPVTVCTSRKCAELYKVGDITKWHYKQRCHDPCCLSNVPKEVIGSPELVNCAAIDRSTKACVKCQCDFSIHMHVYYLSKTIDSKIIDSNIKQNIDTKEKLLQNARKLIKDISIRKEELEKEHKIIVNTCAKFAFFLQNNAITPFCDSYKEYIEYLIIRERSLGVLSKMSVIRHLQSLLFEYEAAKQSFTEALSIKKKPGEEITPQKIQDSIQELYSLKHNGKKIKELYDCQKKSRTKEHKYTEYIHEMNVQLQEDRTKIDKEKQKNTPQSKKQNRKSTDGNQKSGNQQKGKSQTQHRMRRDQSPPPSYFDLHSTQHFSRDRQYQYRDNSRSHYPYNHPPEPHYHPQDVPQSDYHHPPDYRRPDHHSLDYHHPDYHRPDYHKSGYRQSNYAYPNYPASSHPQSYLPAYDRPRSVPGPDPDYRRYSTPDSHAYSPGNNEGDMNVQPRSGNDGGDSYEFRVVLNKKQQSRTVPPTDISIPPPLLSSRDHLRQDFYPPVSPTDISRPTPLRPSRDHLRQDFYPPVSPTDISRPPPLLQPRDYFQQDLYPRPRAPYPPYYEGHHQYNDRRPYNNYGQRQGSSVPRTRPNPNRFNERDNTANNRGRGGYRGGRGQKKFTQKFKTTTYRKTNKLDADSESDSNSD